MKPVHLTSEVYAVEASGAVDMQGALYADKSARKAGSTAVPTFRAASFFCKHKFLISAILVSVFSAASVHLPHIYTRW